VPEQQVYPDECRVKGTQSQACPKRTKRSVCFHVCGLPSERLAEASPGEYATVEETDAALRRADGRREIAIGFTNVLACRVHPPVGSRAARA
jgi:hypothetical protein